MTFAFDFLNRRSQMLSIWLSVTIILSTPVFGRADGILDEVRSEVDQPPKASEERPKKRRRHHDHDCDDDPGFFAQVAGPIFVMGITSPWWVPHVALEDSFEYEAVLPRYPYQDGLPGSLAIFSDPPPGSKSWAGQFTAEYGTNFDGLERIGGRYLIEGKSRFGIDTEFNSWLEELPAGNDTLWTGDLNIVHRFAQSERVQFRSGIGVNWLEDHGDTEAGFNFTYGVDVYPLNPWVFSNTIDLGTLGDATRFHFRSSVGVQVRNVELFTGFDYQRIGSADMSGIMTGVKLSF